MFLMFPRNIFCVSATNFVTRYNVSEVAKLRNIQFAGTTLVLYAGGRQNEQVPDVCFYGWCKLFQLGINYADLLLCSNYQITRVLAHKWLI